MVFLPYTAPGMRIGLLGGSFDPPHSGHVHITRAALARFDLTHVWWLVSPGNPLKARGPAPLEARMSAAWAIMQHPRVRVTALEAQLGTVYTAATIAALQARAPEVRFTWLMGADNMAQIHRWRDWPEIFARVPVGVLARPGDRLAARTAPAARLFRGAMLAPSQSRLLSRADPPAWCFVNLPMRGDSSTALRNAGKWPGRDI